MGIGWPELIVVFCVVLLFFGARRIPEVARALGKASREFKSARDSVVDEVKKSTSESEVKPEQKAGDVSASKPERSDDNPKDE